MSIRVVLTLLAVSIFAIPHVRGQNHVVSISGLSFVDSISGTSVTTITLGTTIEWQNPSNQLHTAASGVFPQGPFSGALFSIYLAGGSSGTYTPSSVGTIPYYCDLHFIFGMTGSIVVTLTPQVLNYPGSGEDFRLLTALTPVGSTSMATPTTGIGNDVKAGLTSDYLTVAFDSPIGTLTSAPLISLAQIFTHGSPPAGPMGLFIAPASAVILIDGLTPNAMGQQTVVGATATTYAMPAALAGNSIMLQGLAITPSATNGFFALSEGHEIWL